VKRYKRLRMRRHHAKLLRVHGEGTRRKGRRKKGVYRGGKKKRQKRTEKPTAEKKEVLPESKRGKFLRENAKKDF